MKVFITGAAGFIGHALVKRLADGVTEIVGMDNINDYYDQRLKYARLADCGIRREDVKDGALAESHTLPGYRFIHADLTDGDTLRRLFEEGHFTHIVNLAGQAGVRYSIENPMSYVKSNVEGFLNILECGRHYGVSHLVYASSSSIYGMNESERFTETDDTDHPVSLYAATKKSDELMAHAYSKLYHLPTTGLRFFTVYGPWGRPDMAPLKFTDAICQGRTINVYNNGDMERDFTYIDDIIDGLMLTLSHPSTAEVPFNVYNIGCSHPDRLLDFIHDLEEVTGHKAQMNMMPMQPGDVKRTYADVTKISSELGYQPKVILKEGLRRMYAWYCKYSEGKK